MRYVRPDGTAARVVLVEDGVAWLHDGVTVRLGWLVPVHGYALDWTDGPTLGAVEHDVLGPAGWWVERSALGSRARLGGRAGKPWRHSFSEALRDALAACDG
jgi:hypothetical protein